MHISVMGLMVVLAILLFVYFARTSLFAALMISLAFGSTSAVTLTAIGGSSPLIYTIFTAIFLLSVLAHKNIWRDIGDLFGRSAIPWIICTLFAYAILGAMLFPRLFAGQTTVFVASRVRGGVFEVPLEPVSGNMTQTAYFVLSGLVFLAVFIYLLRTRRLIEIQRGFILWATANAALGVVDLAGKLAGLGDILFPIRTANYALLTEAVQGSFWRIAGGQSEASAFGGVTLASLAFTYSYWRKTGDRYTFLLSLLLLALLILSTSSTAYVGLGILCVPVGLSILRSFFVNRLELSQVLVISISGMFLLTILFITVVKPDFLHPFQRLINDMLVNKLSSTSGEERSYWNYKSLQSFVDTSGFGVGIGSSRASSWPIAVISQLGILGAVLMAALVAPLLRPIRKLNSYIRPEEAATIASVRTCAFAGIVTGSLVSGTADPGIVFFVSLAVISVQFLWLRYPLGSPRGQSSARSPEIGHTAIPSQMALRS